MGRITEAEFLWVMANSNSKEEFVEWYNAYTRND